METTSYTKYHKAYYNNHREDIRQRQAIYQKEYYKKNRDRIINRVKEYQKAKAQEAPAAQEEN